MIYVSIYICISLCISLSSRGGLSSLARDSTAVTRERQTSSNEFSTPVSINAKCKETKANA